MAKQKAKKSLTIKEGFGLTFLVLGISCIVVECSPLRQYLNSFGLIIIFLGVAQVLLRGSRFEKLLGYGCDTFTRRGSGQSSSSSSSSNSTRSGSDYINDPIYSSMSQNTYHSK